MSFTADIAKRSLNTLLSLLSLEKQRDTHLADYQELFIDIFGPSYTNKQRLSDRLASLPEKAKERRLELYMGKRHRNTTQVTIILEENQYKLLSMKASQCPQKGISLLVISQLPNKSVVVSIQCPVVDLKETPKPHTLKYFYKKFHANTRTLSAALETERNSNKLSVLEAMTQTAWYQYTYNLIRHLENTLILSDSQGGQPRTNYRVNHFYNRDFVPLYVQCFHKDIFELLTRQPQNVPSLVEMCKIEEDVRYYAPKNDHLYEYLLEVLYTSDNSQKRIGNGLHTPSPKEYRSSGLCKVKRNFLRSKFLYTTFDLKSEEPIEELEMAPRPATPSKSIQEAVNDVLQRALERGYALDKSWGFDESDVGYTMPHLLPSKYNLGSIQPLQTIVE